MTCEEQKEIEVYLSKVYYAEKDRRRIRLELERAQKDYESAYEIQSRSMNFEVVVQKYPSTRSPTEEAAIAIVQDYRRAVEDLEKELLLCNAIIDDVHNTVERAVQSAGLDDREKEYIRLRYYEQHSTEYIEKEMFCTHSYRIREAALKKIERVRK